MNYPFKLAELVDEPLVERSVPTPPPPRSKLRLRLLLPGTALTAIAGFALVHWTTPPERERQNTVSKEITVRVETIKALSAQLDRSRGKDVALANRVIDEATRLKTISESSNAASVQQAILKAGLALLSASDRGQLPSDIALGRTHLALASLAAHEPRAALGMAILSYENRLKRDPVGITSLFAKLQDDVQALPPVRQAAVLRQFAQVAAQGDGPAAIEMAYRFSALITSPEQRADSLHETAVAQLARRSPATAPLSAQALRSTASDPALIRASWQAARQGNTRKAILLALAISAPQARDRMLALAVTDISGTDRIEHLLPGLLGIRATPLRDDALLDFVSCASEANLLHEAEQAQAAIVDSDRRLVATSVLAAKLAKDSYADRATALLPDVAAIRIMRSAGMREVAAAKTASALADLHRPAEAQSVLALAGNPGDIRSAAAFAIFKSLSDSDGAIAHLQRVTQLMRGEDLARSMAALAARVALEGDPDRAARMVDEIDDAPIRHAARARLAMSTPMPHPWLVRAIREAQQARYSELDVDGVLAGLYLGDGQIDAAWRHLHDASDLHLTQDVGAAIAARLARSGRADEIAALMRVLDDDDVRGRDLFRRSAISALAEANRLPEATALARRIEDNQARVATFRSLAVAQARRNDVFNALSGKPMPPPDAGNADDDRAPVLRRASFNLYENGQSDLGERLPALPNAAEFTAKSVLAHVPAVTPATTAKVEIVPMANNGFNKKFLTARNFDAVTFGGPTIVMQAQQSSYPVYIHIASGTIDLPTLREKLIELGHSNMLTRKDRTYTLRVPLFVASNARLVISGTDVAELRLSNERATYLVNSGTIYFSDTHVVGWSEAAKAPMPMSLDTAREFRPFYIGWSNSHTYAVRSHFSSLGRAAGKAYGFSLSAGPMDQMALTRENREPTGVIVDNTFEHMLYGFYSWEAADVAIVGNEYRDNLIYGVDPHDWSKRLLVAYNTAYGAAKKHGIIGSRHVEDSWFLGNVTFDNHGSGLMMDRFSGRNVLYANTAFGNGGNGISIYESPCNIVAGNSIYANAGNGVLFRNSWDVGVYHNTIFQNRALGVGGYAVEFFVKPSSPVRDLALDPYERFTTAAIASNRIAHNHAGAIGIQAMAAAALRDNVIVGAGKRTYLGDLKPLQADIASQGAKGVIVGASCPKTSMVYSCPFADTGYLPSLMPKASLARPRYSSCPESTTVNARTAKVSGSQSTAIGLEKIDPDALLPGLLAPASSHAGGKGK